MSTLVISFSSMAWCIQIFAIQDIRGHIFICEMFGWSSHWIKPIICHWTYFCWPGNYDITYQTVHQSIFISPKNNIMMIFSLCWYDLWKIALFISFRSLCLALHQLKLDESTTRQPLKSPWSLSGRSIHLTLVTKWSWSWSWPWMTYCHPLCAMSIGPPILRYSYLKIWPWKSMVKVMCVVKGRHVGPSKFKGLGYGQGQTHWSHLRPGVQLICLLFVSWQSDHFWLRCSKFYIWPWKI